MEYKDIISISNMGGLYSLITTKSDGAIVNNIEDGSKKFVSGRKHDFTPLESIEVYTQDDNVPLVDIFISFKSQDKKISSVDVKKASKDELYAFISEVYPDIDTERVYPSDIKKMVKWYRLLRDNKLLDNLEKTQPTSDEEE